MFANLPNEIIREIIKFARGNIMPLSSANFAFRRKFAQELFAEMLIDIDHEEYFCRKYDIKIGSLLIHYHRISMPIDTRIEKIIAHTSLFADKIGENITFLKCEYVLWYIHLLPKTNLTHLIAPNLIIAASDLPPNLVHLEVCGLYISNERQNNKLCNIKIFGSNADNYISILPQSLRSFDATNMVFDPYSMRVIPATITKLIIKYCFDTLDFANFINLEYLEIKIVLLRNQPHCITKIISLPRSLKILKINCDPEVIIDMDTIRLPNLCELYVCRELQSDMAAKIIWPGVK